MSATRVRVLAGALLCVALIAVFAVHRLGYPPPDAAIRVTEVEFSSDLSPGWRALQLPDDWRAGRPTLQEGFYRFRVDLQAEPLRLAAVYLPTVSQNAALFVNGVEVGNGGPFGESPARHFPRPLIIPVPPGVLRAGDNEFLLRVVATPAGQGLLPPLYFGDRDTLWRDYSARHALKVSAMFAFAITQIVMAVLLIPISVRLNATGEPGASYGWAGVCIVALTGHMLPMLLERPPLGPVGWELWRHLCIGVFVVGILFFANSYLERRNRMVERLVLASFVSAVSTALILVVLDPAFYLRVGARAWGAYALIVGTVPMLRMIASHDERHPWRAALMSAAGGLIFVLGAHDVGSVVGLWSRVDGYLIHFAAPLATLVFTGVLFSQFVEARHALVALNRDLEERVALKTEELVESTRRLNVLELERARERERERLRRDMHDGLGGTLAGALSLAERDAGDDSALVQLLRDAQLEMRMIIAAAGPGAREPGMAFGVLRERFARQAASAGMVLEWRIGDTPSWVDLDADRLLDLIRVAQEAVSNAVRHSGGRRLSVRLGQTGGALELRIADDGGRHAIESLRSLPGAGRGLVNMRARARSMGATLTIERVATGTVVLLRLPACDQKIKASGQLRPVGPSNTTATRRTS